MRRRRRINETSHDFNIKAILIDNKARAGVKIITRRKIHSDTATSRGGARKLRKMYEEYAGTDSKIILLRYTVYYLAFDSCQIARKV